MKHKCRVAIAERDAASPNGGVRKAVEIHGNGDRNYPLHLPGITNWCRHRWYIDIVEDNLFIVLFSFSAAPAG